MFRNASISLFILAATISFGFLSCSVGPPGALTEKKEPGDTASFFDKWFELYVSKIVGPGTDIEMKAARVVETNGGFAYLYKYTKSKYYLRAYGRYITSVKDAYCETSTDISWKKISDTKWEGIIGKSASKPCTFSDGYIIASIYGGMLHKIEIIDSGHIRSDFKVSEGLRGYDVLYEADPAKGLKYAIATIEMGRKPASEEELKAIKEIIKNLPYRGSGALTK